MAGLVIVESPRKDAQDQPAPRGGLRRSRPSPGRPLARERRASPSPGSFCPRPRVRRPPGRRCWRLRRRRRGSRSRTTVTERWQTRWGGNGRPESAGRQQCGSCVTKLFSLRFSHLQRKRLYRGGPRVTAGLACFPAARTGCEPGGAGKAVRWPPFRKAIDELATPTRVCSYRIARSFSAATASTGGTLGQHPVRPAPTLPRRMRHATDP